MLIFCVLLISYENEDGTVVSQEGELKKMDDEGHEGESVQGAYSYKDDDGNEYKVTYTADENGYRPVSIILLFRRCCVAIV